MKTNIGFIAAAAITTASALISACFSVVILSQGHWSDELAMYGAARSVPIAVLVLIAWRSRSWDGMMLLGSLMSTIQLFDAIIGFYVGDYSKAVGPLVLACVNTAALSCMGEKPTEEQSYRTGVDVEQANPSEIS